MAENNPWSNEFWSVTEQGRYLERYGRARAEARARDAGTFFGGPRPLPPAQRAARGDPSNPWSQAGYNVTAQIAYLQQNGQARAEARARDAGTTLAQAAMIRPKDQPIFKIPGKGFAIMHRRPRDVLISARINLGLGESVEAARELYLDSAMLLGVSTDVSFTFTGLTSNMDVGIDMSILLDLTATLRIATDGTVRVTSDGTQRVIIL